MKSLLLAVLLCLVAFLHASQDEAQLKIHFEKFIQEHNKSYPNENVKQLRFNVFKANMNLVDRLNADAIRRQSSAVYGVTPFFDMTTDEFKKTKLMRHSTSDDNKNIISYLKNFERTEFNATDLPDSFDWRDKHAVTDVKDQASCGSCWAFAATQQIESAWFLAGNPLTKLSPMQLVECDNVDCGCYGGWHYQALDWVIQHGGMASEESYSYCIPPLGKCYPCSANVSYCGKPDYCNSTCHTTAASVATVKSWERVANNPEQIAAALVQNGPLSVGLNAMWLQFYHSGVSDPSLCDTGGIDHAVLIVGYGVHAGLFRKEPYWIVKNSWGTKWGESGFFRMYRGKNKCGIESMVISAKA